MLKRFFECSFVLLFMTSVSLSHDVQDHMEEPPLDTQSRQQPNPSPGCSGLFPGFCNILSGFTEAFSTFSTIFNNTAAITEAIRLRREVRSAGRQIRDLSTVLTPFLSSFSVLAQAASYLPGVIQAFVGGVSGSVDFLGKGIVTVGTGVNASAMVIDAMGKSVQTLATSVPSLVAFLVTAGSGLLFLYPGLQAAFFSALASNGFKLAGKIAGSARTFVDDTSLWSTLLQTLEVFAQKASGDFA